MVYRGGTQAKNLRKELNKRTPPNAVIVDYEFYKNHSTAEEGWLFIWKVQCDHSSNFRKVDDKEEMSVVPNDGWYSIQFIKIAQNFVSCQNLNFSNFV